MGLTASELLWGKELRDGGGPSKLAPDGAKRIGGKVRTFVWPALTCCRR